MTSDILGEGKAPTAEAVSMDAVQNIVRKENIPAPFSLLKTDLFVNDFKIAI
jgi:hypothetical protein